MDYTYLLLMPDEDGNCVKWLKAFQLKDIAKLMEDYGISEWKEFDPNDLNPMEWAYGTAMLIEANVTNPKPVKVVQQWQLRKE